jgi:FkbM family methyltransferase
MLRKLARQRNIFRNLRNPWVYFGYKYGVFRREPLFLELRNGVTAEVPRRMLRTFKESVFDEDYIKEFPRELIHGFHDLTVVDVGANVGYFSLWWLSRFPGSTIIAAEPMPNNFALLARNQALNPDKKFNVVNCAVRSQPGNITLNFDRGDSFTTAASVLKNAGARDEISVKAVSLLQLLADFNLSRIDFLKLDCEGSEYDILYHCDEKLLDSIRCIAMEVHPSVEADESRERLCEFLRSKKFHVVTKSGSDLVHAYR